MIRVGAFLTALLALALVASASLSDTLEGRVTTVHDGDTVTVQVGDTPTRIRLSGIDAPERGQPWSAKAKQALTKRALGKDVRVIEVDIDPYGRTVGEVYADDVCVGCELVREGHAWVYRRYTDDEVLLRLEAEAREKRVGIWSLPEYQRVPPWEWRRAGRATGERDDVTRSRSPRHANFACGAKHVCREMTSCQEARFHLDTCGLTRLDGDGDGIPCEKLCRRE